ncbi:MAG: metal dependent phosphohydrolase, partial [Phycisphaerales bacterium]|nr:metal dependent phosphohydrolase [Phycisphaerales bacterium]
FSQQLSQTYEEVNLNYRMDKLLTSAAEPEDVVRTMCDELRQTMNYGWLAMSFADGESVLAPLRRKLLHAGALPCDRDQFIAECPTADAATERVLSPGRHTLANLAKSEVLIEQVTHDQTPVGVLAAGNRKGEESDVTSSEMQLVEAAGNFLGLFHQNAFRFAEQRRQFLGTLHALSAAVDAKDPYTRGHSERVALLGSQLARVVGLDADFVEAVRVAGLLHDIGKIGVPESVLRKPARLTDEEFALIKKHPETGYEILKDLPSLTFHLPGVLYHHERWDGRGYPHNLKGDSIPMIARLLSFADTFDAMSSNRAYRRGMDRERVLAEIRKSSGTQLDPDLIEPFVTMDFTAFDQMLKEQEMLASISEVAA